MYIYCVTLGLPTLLKLSYRSIWSSRLRTIITITIIALGIMALVGINIVIDSMKGAINDSFSSMGAGTFRIDAQEEVQLRNQKSLENEQTPISQNEYQKFEELYQLPGTISVYFYSKSSVKASLGQNETNPNLGLIATDENYLIANDIELDYGRNFNEHEIRAGNNVCIIGNGVTKNLFDRPSTAIDTVIQLDGLPYKVIGIQEPKGGGMSRGADNSVLVTMLNSRQNFPSVSPEYLILVKSPEEISMSYSEDEATGIMRQARSLDPREGNNFTINTNKDLLKSLNENLSYVSLAAMVIGIITLISAAVGLMNIMLVSVVERTKEVGLQKAIGATSANIRNQFLTESILISLIGGLIGILMGIMISLVLSSILHTSFYLPWLWVGIGIAVCLVVGVIAGIYPALKASRLRPIEALRYE